MTRNLKERFFTSISLIILLVLIFKFKLILLSTLILGVLAIIEFFNLTKNILRNKLNYFLNHFYILFIYILFYVLYISYFHELKIILFCVLFACIASDTAVMLLVIGGRSKLTKISPKKTISGAVGSVIFSCISFSLLIYFFK